MNINEKFYFEVPTIKRKEETLLFFKECCPEGKSIPGVGGLDRYLDDYEGWLEKLNQDYVKIPDEDRVPARTYFLIRQNDNRIIGMINIRLVLNEKLKDFGGHIGYTIRPSERGKGYNKINLYLALKYCHEHGLDKVMLDADINNPASWKTMEALGGVRIREHYHEYHDEMALIVVYEIDVNKSLLEHSYFEKNIIWPIQNKYN